MVVRVLSKFGSAIVTSKPVYVPVGTSDRNGRRMMRRVSHRHQFDYTPKQGYLYVCSRAISSRTNDNFDTFPAEEIKKAYRSFIGKPVFVNHHNDDHRRMRGVIIDAALHEDTAPDGRPDTWAEVLMEVDAQRFPKLAQAVVAGHIDRTSMGTDVAFSICSVCSNKATNPAEYCAHIPRMKGQKIYRTTASGEKVGTLVHEVCYGLGFFENSLLVEEPADPTAFVYNVDTRGLSSTAARAIVREAEQVLAEAVALPPTVLTRAKTASRRTPTAPSAPGAPAPSGEYLLRTAMGEDDFAQHFNDEMKGSEGNALGGHLWDGFAKAMGFADGDHMKTSRQNRDYDTLAQRYHGQPGKLGFDESDEPYYEVHHSSGWRGRMNVGPYMELRHDATPDEAHEVLDVGHQPNGGSDGHLLHPGMATADPEVNHARAHKVLDDFVHESGSEYADSIPRIKRWNGRRGLASLHLAGKDDPDGDTAVETDNCSLCGKPIYKVKNSAMGGWQHDIDGAAGLPHQARPGKKKESAKTFPASDWHEANSGQKCSRWGCDKDAVASRKTGNGEMGACGTHKAEMTKDSSRRTASDDDLSEQTCSAIHPNWRAKCYIKAHVQHDQHMARVPANAHRGPSIVKWPNETKTATRRLAYGETVAPPDVDTLREEECPVCGEKDAFDGGDCQVCGYVAPPEMFRDPDLDMAKQVDLRKDVADEAASDPNGDGLPDAGLDQGGQMQYPEPMDPSALGDPADPSAQMPGQDPSAPDQPVDPNATGVPALDPNVQDQMAGAEGPLDPTNDGTTEVDVVGGPQDEQGYAPDGQQQDPMAAPVNDPADNVLSCPNCGYSAPSTPPSSVSTQDVVDDPSASGDGLVSGDVCPNCGQAAMQTQAQESASMVPGDSGMSMGAPV